MSDCPRGKHWLTCDRCDGQGFYERNCDVKYITCNANGCNNGKVEIDEGVFSDCTACDGKGVLSCPICGGQGTYQDPCSNCHGATGWCVDD